MSISNGGVITPELFTATIAPLMAQAGAKGCDTRTCADALTALVPFRRCRAAAAASHDFEAAASMTSPAARCAVSVLCMIFSMLDMPSFAMTQQCCRSWRTVRLHPASWPRGGNVDVYTIMLCNGNSQVKLEALRGFQDEHHQAVSVVVLWELESLLLTSADVALQVRICFLFIVKLT
jgi:hypothetical protein